jgi:hypothetical protein
MTTPTVSRSRSPESVSYRLVSLILMGIAVVVGFVYILIGRTYSDGQALGPSTFPTMLGILLIGSCLVGALIAVRQEDQRVPLGDLLGVVLAILNTAAYLILWDLTDWFYPATFVYLFCLITYLRGTKPCARSVLTDAIVSTAMAVFVFLFFDLLLGVRF